MYIVTINQDSSLNITYPAIGAQIDSESDIDFVNRIAQKDLPGQQYYIVDSLPDDYFFEAWRYQNEIVVIDMDAARIVHMNYLREIRMQRFIQLGFPIKLDSDLEKSIIPQETINILNNLRNIPQVFDLTVAQTPEDLKLLLPTILKE